MDDEIGRTAMTRMLDLGNVLELVNDALNDRSFAHEQFIRKMHKMALHVFAQSSDEMKSLFEGQLRQGSRNVPTIPDQLAAQPFHHLRNRSTIIDVAWSQAAGKPLASVIDRQVQLEAKEPTHACLAAPGIHRKDAMLTDPFGIAHFQRSRVDEADACAGSIPARAA